jgi:two-component system sensor histidine kinase DesK
VSEMTAPNRSRQWLVVVHLGSIGFVAASAAFSLAFPVPSPVSPPAWVALSMVLVAGALQLRHSFAAAAGVRPRYWQASLLLLLALAYGPIGVFGVRWFSLQWFALASLAMLAPGPHGFFVVVSAVMHAIWFATANAGIGPPQGLPAMAWSTSYMLVIQLLAGGALYAVTRLVRLTEQLSEARGSLADLTVGRERLRIARDLRDLLGQSLSAISLKGDVAIRLLEHGDAAAADVELDGLIMLARSALHDLRTVPHAAPPVTFALEAERAVDLISSAGVETRVRAVHPSLAPSVDALFAWAVREGVTNVLRHSAATTCTITCEAREARSRLEIVNDGALPPLDASGGEPRVDGTGLGGLHARAAALGGFARGERLRDGRFRLVVDVPTDGMPSPPLAAPVQLTSRGAP